MKDVDLLKGRDRVWVLLLIRKRETFVMENRSITLFGHIVSNYSTSFAQYSSLRFFGVVFLHFPPEASLVFINTVTLL